MSGHHSTTAGSSASGEDVTSESITVASTALGSLLHDQSSATSTPLAEGLDKLLQEHDNTLAGMATAAADSKFKEELTTIEFWFKVLSKPERTASVYTLLQHSDQDQIRFFISMLQQMLKTDNDKSNIDSIVGTPQDTLTKSKPAIRGLRPPSLNLPLPGTPPTPHFTPATSRAESMPFSGLPATGASVQELPMPADKMNWASTVTTPAVPMFQKSEGKAGNNVPATVLNIPGVGTLNPLALNMVASSGLSNEAQLLALQLVMSGLVQPASAGTPPSAALPKPAKKFGHGNWRTPTSAKYPGSALRHSSLRSSGLKSAGLKSAGLDSASSNMATPKEEDFNPEVLSDVPAWLRSLRLHKYTTCFEGMSWQEMVALDDTALEKKGIATLGARRRLLRTFEIVRKKMGLEDPSSATPTTSALVSRNEKEEEERIPPHSAAPTMGLSKLSAESPVFVPGGEGMRVPHSAAPVA
ncbi:hypothetical protein AMATHDRAFT_2541 [Amanita thiersii Skay4041]|uniref:SAM domain-containing protein n=1 Tax=Amanita thiersii Skay4041 TaxID=703135 RepID=A0A2A9NPL6_9AGAR|nr:hypothetical protein AMATHDRAFT_2541 [Amanita thiersii Skay4041]